MKTPSCLVLTTLALALVLRPVSAQTFTVVGLPDTQNYSENFPAIFSAQTQWIANNINTLDIRYVSHFGDLVQHGDRINEWMNADAAMSILDATGLCNGVTAGNHDITQNGSAFDPYIPQEYFNFFGPHRYDSNEWFGGASPSGMSSYQFFEAGGLQFLTLHIECCAAMRELEWAQGILDANRDKPVLFTTHRYIQDAEAYTAGFPVVPSGRYPDVWYTVEGVYTPDGNMSEDIFDWFVRRNPNIFMVMCGHFHEEFRQTSTNAYGKAVYEILADYQDDPNGGNGWLRIMQFDLGAGTIDFDSYSPTLNAFRSGVDESDFTLPLAINDYHTADPTVVLQQGIASYQGTQDTWISEDEPNRAFGNEPVRVSDDDVSNSIFSDERGQAMIRFDGLIGPAGSGRIPVGAQIASAHLSIQISDDIDTPFFNPNFEVYPVLVPWNEQSTWNSLGGGLSGSELGPLLATFAGDNNPDGDGLRRIDITTAVQMWASGAPNHGIAILPQIISGNDDGIEILTSESANPLLRPRLEVVWQSPCGYTEYGAGSNPAVTMSLSGLGVPAVGGSMGLVTNGAPSAEVVTAVSAAANSVPLLGGTLLVDETLFLGTPDISPSPLGRANWFIQVPPISALTGLKLFFQSFAADAQQPFGVAFSNGLEVEFCQ